MKRLLVILIICLLSNLSHAQVSFSQAAGIKYFIGNGDGFNVSPYSSVGFLYSPRLNVLAIGKNSTLSVGSHMAFTFQTTSNDDAQTNSQDLTPGFGYDLPLVAEFNFGLGCSTNKDDNLLGFYIGGGYAMHNTKLFLEAITGPIVTGGARVNLGGRYLDINASYLMGSDNRKDHGVLGLGLQFMIDN